MDRVEFKRLFKSYETEFNAIKRLKQKIVTNNDLAKYLQECNVCLEDNKTNALICGNCYNHICIDCFNQIKKHESRRKCPICRTKFTKKTEITADIDKDLVSLLYEDNWIRLYSECTKSLIKKDLHQMPIYPEDMIYEIREQEPQSDGGAIFIPFDLYPGEYVPSGHINVTRAREQYSPYSGQTSGVFVTSELSPEILHIIMDGAAGLRYA